MPRVLTSWIDSFVEYTQDLPTTDLWRKWAAISCIAGALERRVWIRAWKSNVYPNNYIVLVGPAGKGKTVLSSMVYEFIAELKDHHLAPSSVSKASLMDAMRGATRHVILPNQVAISYNALFAVIDELGVFLPKYESEFMATLTALWDGKPYKEMKRTNELNFEITKPTFNFLAATTPTNLNQLLPEGAFELGFMARTIMVYSGGTGGKRASLFGDGDDRVELREDLVNDLKCIAETYGKFVLSSEASETIVHWDETGQPPMPDHPKLLAYNVRRTAHLLKLCLVAACDRGSDHVIELPDYQRAFAWLLEAEMYMPDVFKSMASGGEGKVIDDCWYFVMTRYSTTTKPVREDKIVAFLAERVPSHSVMRVLDIMVRAGVLLAPRTDENGYRTYVPQVRRE